MLRLGAACGRWQARLLYVQARAACMQQLRVLPAPATGRRAASSSSGNPSTSASKSSLVVSKRFKNDTRQLDRFGRAAALAFQALGAAGSGLSAAGGEDAGAGGAPAAGGQESGLGSRKPVKAGGDERRGPFQRLPHVIPPQEHLRSAAKRAGQQAARAGSRTDADKARSRGARQLDTLMQELVKPLTRYVAGFPDPGTLHPFERDVAALTIDLQQYKQHVLKIDRLRKALLETGKTYAARTAKAPGAVAAAALAEEGSAELQRLFLQRAWHLESLKAAASALSGLQYVEPALPTLALVGAPNVGKSSLVQVLSSGVPEVCNYPFTTRTIKMGHFYIDGKKHQVTDTPGLLRRADEERNKMELLTLAVLSQLPSSALFVADLTGDCGTSVSDQWAIRSELRRRHSDKVWIDVFSKADLLAPVFEQADVRIAAAAAAAAAAASSQPPSLDVGEVQDAVDFASRVPRALRVSSLTKQGIQGLKAEIIQRLVEQPLGAAAGAAAEAAASAGPAAAAGAAASASQQPPGGAASVAVGSSSAGPRYPAADGPHGWPAAAMAAD